MAGRIRAKGFQQETNTSLWACLGRLKNYKDGTPIHPYTLATNIGLFMFAGHDTTAHTISWTLFELAANLDIQVCAHPLVALDLNKAYDIIFRQSPAASSLETYLFG